MALIPCENGALCGGRSSLPVMKVGKEERCESKSSDFPQIFVKPLVVEAKANTRIESAKIRNRRMLKKEAAKRVGEELVKACVDLDINEISYYDRDGFAHGERMQAFEIAIASYGFLPR
ncbi:hypothetical protein GQ457_15G004870 [Hibiscus cannabinus]